MINSEIAEIFQKMAEIMEFNGDPKDKFRIIAYQNAVITVSSLSDDLVKLAKEKALTNIRGIGNAIASKIEEFIETGRIKEYEILKKSVPKGIIDMFNVPSLGPKRIKKLYLELNIKSISELQKAIEEGKVQNIPGFGEKSAAKILEGIELKKTIIMRRPIGEIFLIVNEILEILQKLSGVQKTVAAGSFRRREETIGDIDILVTGDIRKSGVIMKKFVSMPFVDKILAQGETKSQVVMKDGMQIDLRLVKPIEFGSALQYFTGSKQHNVALRIFAKNRGYKISEYGFFKGTKKIAGKTEADCYKSLGMQFIPPEIRHNSGEIEAALKNNIPKLIERADIKGDLHVHSTWSDGNNSIEEMVIEAQKMGYEYVAITDHSPSLRIANGLSSERLLQKKKEIESVQKKVSIKILFGTEVDILADGSIDYDNDILKQFDIVVASIHSRFGDDNTARLISAMHNPYVHIIGHPSGRLIGQRKPYSLDYEQIFKAASETKTVLEINSQYLRLDLMDIHIRAAKRWKCKFAINTDSHTDQSLSLMNLGVGWARRGWCEADDVVNTLPLPKLLKILK